MKRTHIATLIGASVMLLAAESRQKRAVSMYASDVVARSAATVSLRVGMTADAGNPPIAGETVEFFLNAVDGRELAEPVRIGAAQSDGAGRATHEWNPDAWADVRRFDIAARLAAGSHYAAQTRIQVFVPPADRPLLLLKLDADTQDASDPPSASPARPAVSGSKVLEKLGGLYQFVYLSTVDLRAAPAFKAWIERRRLPAGPLLLLDDDDSAAPRSDEERATKRIKEVVQAHPRTAIGIGATAADARAFADNGLAAIVVPQDLKGVGKLPPDALATTNWTTVYAHARLCEMSEELLRTFERGGAEALEARSYLEKLGRPGVACVDRWRNEPPLRSAAIYISGLLRGVDGFDDAIDRSTAEALRDSLLAAWRFGEPSVVRRLYADPRAADSDPLPTFERWEALGEPRQLDNGSVVYAVRLTAADGKSSVREITCVRQVDSTWHVGGVAAASE